MPPVANIFSPPKPPKMPDNSKAEERLAKQEREAEATKAATIAARRGSRGQTIFGSGRGVTEAGPQRPTLG